MEKISFLTLAVHPFWVKQTVLLAESLRAFGGTGSQAQLVILTPSATTPLSTEFKTAAAHLNAEVVPIEIEEAALKFPLGFLPFAASAGEKMVSGRSELLAWVLPDTLIVSELDSFLLPPTKHLAYRPVHHSNIGSEFSQDLDEYWALVYEHCQVPPANIFPMSTCTRDKVLRPYINAGILVVRPEQGFLEAWAQSFQQAYQSEKFKPLLKNQRSAIFLHQAILSGIMMNRYTQSELQELPEAVNYPLHLHHEYPEEHQPVSLNKLITCRYETIDELKTGMEKIGVEEPLTSWLDEKIGSQG